MLINSVPVGRGSAWIGEGFGLFRLSPFTWMLILVIFSFIVMLLFRLPYGGFVALVLQPVLMGGLLQGCSALEQDEKLRVGHLFDGFQYFQSLAFVGLLYAIGDVIAHKVGDEFGLSLSMALASSELFNSVMAGMVRPFMGSPLASIPLYLGTLATGPAIIAFALTLPLVMAVYFAPALVVFGSLSAMESMEVSFSACRRNLLPFLLFGILSSVLVVVGMIPLGLGLLVVMPGLFASVYAGFRDIFDMENDQPAEAKTFSASHAGTLATDKTQGFAWPLVAAAVAIALLAGRHWLAKPEPAVAETFTSAETAPLSRQARAPRVRIEMALIPAGTILIGSAEGENEAEDDEKPAHRVTVSKFKLGKTEVTQRQWEAVMGFNPSSFQECGGDCPVEKVSFEEVQAFIERLNAQTGETYRLPTEAEWEYACRAGGDSLYCGGNDLDALAWHGEDGKAGNTTHPAGSKQANAWGLHDMTGNVGEWTCSAYTEHYGDGSELDCATASPQVVVRGGSWFNENPAELRRANREGKYQSDRFVNLGFRLAKDVSGQLPRL